MTLVVAHNIVLIFVLVGLLAVFFETNLPLPHVGIIEPGTVLLLALAFDDYSYLVDVGAFEEQVEVGGEDTGEFVVDGK